MNITKRLTPLLIILSLVSTPAAARLEVYSGIPLLGTEESPSNNSTGFGALTAIYDEDSKTLYYEFEWELGGDAETTAAHFHGPAALGQNAPAVIDLGPVSGKSGKQTGSVVLTGDQEADLKAGLWYLNIHSNAFPGGEIRGQLFDTSPLDSVVVFDPTNGKLRIKSVMVPGLGILEAELQLLGGTSPLNFELDNAQLKELGEDEMEKESEPMEEDGMEPEDDPY